jgi:fumarate reductase subunit D
MILILVFAALFALGWIRAKRRGGQLADRLRYGFVHGLVGVLVVFGVATIGDWQGLF